MRLNFVLIFSFVGSFMFAQETLKNTLFIEGSASPVSFLLNKKEFSFWGTESSTDTYLQSCDYSLRFGCEFKKFWSTSLIGGYYNHKIRSKSSQYSYPPHIVGEDLGEEYLTRYDFIKFGLRNELRLEINKEVNFFVSFSGSFLGFCHFKETGVVSYVTTVDDEGNLTGNGYKDTERSGVIHDSAFLYLEGSSGFRFKIIKGLSASIEFSVSRLKVEDTLGYSPISFLGYGGQTKVDAYLPISLRFQF